MSRLTKLVAALLLALWLPATLHCRLEGMGLDTLFACAEANGGASHSDSADCADTACQSIEAGQFALAKSRIDSGVSTAFACVCIACFLTVVPSTPVAAIAPSRQEKLLPLQRTWQFARRAALPARAPDCVA